MPSRRKSPKDYLIPAAASKAGMTVLPMAFTTLCSLLAVIASAISVYFFVPKSQPTTPTIQGTVFPAPLATPTITPSEFYRNNYPVNGIQQTTVIEAVKDDMDLLESMFSWAILIALTIGWAGLIKQGDIEVIGVKVKRKYAFYLVATLYLVVNFALVILFVRLGELLLLLDNANFIDGLSKVTVHTWLLNPYSFFGESLLSRSFGSLGYGLLIFCWWICYTSLYLLRDGKETTTTRTLPVLFLVLGLIALVLIERNYSIISLRLANINADFYSAMNATKLERSIIGFIGIGFGVGLFIFLVNLQSKLSRKPTPSKSDEQPDTNSTSKKEKLVYCPECNLPFKTEKELKIHVNNWHTKKDEKK